MKLLLTGATGFSGKEFLKNLEDEKNDFEEIHVVVRDNSLKSFIQNSSLNIIKHHGDLTDKKFIKKITENIDVILHIAGIQMSKDLFDSAIENKVDWIIAVHTTGRYSKFKVASEEYIAIEDELLNLKNKINITILRPTMIYGSMRDRNMSKLIKFLDKSPVYPVFGNGKNLMQPVNGKDLAIAYKQVLDNEDVTKNKEYNLSGEKPIEYLELLKIVSRKLGKKTSFVRIPIKFSYYTAKIGKKVTSKFPIQDEQVLRMQEDKDFSHYEATKDFEFNPRSFETGIEQQILEYKGE